MPYTEDAKFFDFTDEFQKEDFFQNLRQTYTIQFPAKLVNLLASLYNILFLHWTVWISIFFLKKVYYT